MRIRVPVCVYLPCLPRPQAPLRPARALLPSCVHASLVRPRVQGPEDATVSDQNLPPFVIVDEEGKAVGTIEDGDAVVLFNFRADRCVQISKAFEYETGFTAFDRQRYPKVLRQARGRRGRGGAGREEGDEAQQRRKGSGEGGAGAPQGAERQLLLGCQGRRKVRRFPAGRGLTRARRSRAASLSLCMHTS